MLIMSSKLYVNGYGIDLYADNAPSFNPKLVAERFIENKNYTIIGDFLESINKDLKSLVDDDFEELGKYIMDNISTNNILKIIFKEGTIVKRATDGQNISVLYCEAKMPWEYSYTLRNLTVDEFDALFIENILDYFVENRLELKSKLQYIDKIYTDQIL